MLTLGLGAHGDKLLGGGRVDSERPIKLGFGRTALESWTPATPAVSADSVTVLVSLFADGVQREGI